MVKALLDGTKTQTRRIAKPQPDNPKGPNYDGLYSDTHDPVTRYFACPYGQPGDRLWVREVFCDTSKESKRKPWSYRADESREDADAYPLKWKPSIFMPRAASRITLEIVSVRVEQLWDISEEDAKAEGCTIETPNSLTWSAGFMNAGARRNFCDLWECINGPGSWSKNPWVWIIEFLRV